MSFAGTQADSQLNSNKETFSCMPEQERMMAHNADRLTCFSFSLLVFIVTLLTPGGQISRLGSSYIECLERAQAQMKEYQVCFLFVLPHNRESDEISSLSLLLVFIVDLMQLTASFLTMPLLS